MPLATWSRPQFTAAKNNAAFIITPKEMARMTISRHAGLAASPISCSTGKVSKAIAIEKMGAPSPTMSPIN